MPRAWTLRARPHGLPTQDDFAIMEQPHTPLRDGEVRVTNHWLSVDPYMRGRMNDVESYIPPFALGTPMEGGAVGTVVESRSDRLQTGDIVQHMLGWRDEAVLPEAQAQTLPGLGVEPQAYLGQLGVPGMTAYFGLTAVAGVRAGDVVFVSAAAGAVGSTAVQIAKARGAIVIGSAGGADKCDWVRSLGADHAIDYKAEGALVEKLAAVAPGGIDVYFDNVGGDHLDAALALAKKDARFAICGLIDIYNGDRRTELHHLFRLIVARVRIQGFLVIDYFDRSEEFYKAMSAWHQSGQLALAGRETVHEGLDAMPRAFLELFAGGNTGKMLVKL